jgi:hypothetical protein
MGLGASQDGYENGLGVIDWLPGSDGELFVKIYNDRGAALTNGDVYFLSYLSDADSLTVTGRPTLDPCATTAVYRQVVIVNNAPLNLATIADATWGYVQVRGYCPKVAVTSGVDTAEQYIQGADGTAIAVVESAGSGTTLSNDTFGIAITAYSAGFCTATLFGERSTIG